MLKSALIQGLGTNLPFAFLFAAHSSAIDTILKYGTKKQIDIVSIDAVRKVVKNSGLFRSKPIFHLKRCQGIKYGRYFLQQSKADSQQFHIWKVVSFTPKMGKYLDQVRSGSSHPGE